MRAQLARLWARVWRSGLLLLILANLFWAASMVIARGVHELVPPVALAFWRWVGGLGLVLAVSLPQLRRDMPVLLRHWRVLLLLAVLGIGAYNTISYIGLQTTTALNALLMQSAMPLIVILWSALLFGELPRPGAVAAVLVSLLGVAVIATHGAPAALLRLGLNAGDGWVLLAIAIYAAYTALLRRRPHVHPLSFLAATFALGTLCLLPFYLWERASGAVMQVTATSLLAIAFIAIFPAFVSYLFFNRGVELVGASLAGQSVHLMPLFGSVMAVVWLGEAFHPYHLAGIALIAGGIALATITRKATGGPAAPAPRPALRGG